MTDLTSINSTCSGQRGATCQERLEEEVRQQRREEEKDSVRLRRITRENNRQVGVQWGLIISTIREEKESVTNGAGISAAFVILATNTLDAMGVAPIPPHAFAFNSTRVTRRLLNGSRTLRSTETRTSSGRTFYLSRRR